MSFEREEKVFAETGYPPEHTIGGWSVRSSPRGEHPEVEGIILYTPTQEVFLPKRTAIRLLDTIAKGLNVYWIVDYAPKKKKEMKVD